MNAAERIIPERVPPGDDRNDFERDRDIILYTSAFQRLSSITQVMSEETGHLFHNRLTHTLQVAQVGRRLAQKLRKKQPDLSQLRGGVDPDAVEAACLAHDLGHPPFGHLAEQELNRLAGGEAEGFEGNAQSFRIVCELAFRSTDYSGLNLTRATLRGILKYPWTYVSRPPGKEDKWGAYSSESKSFQFATGSDTGPVQRSAESEIMDWADDLTYAVHDVEDFYRAGLIPLQLLRPALTQQPILTERTRFLEYVWNHRNKIPPLSSASQQDLDDILADILFAHFTLDAAYEGTCEQRQRLRSFTSELVGRYINGLTLQEPASNGKAVNIDEGKEREVAILKQLTWFYVIEAPSLALKQLAQRKVIKHLYSLFRNEARKQPTNLLPAYYRERLRGLSASAPAAGNSVKRAVADLIAGMTETQAIAVYQRAHGIVLGSALDRLIV